MPYFKRAAQRRISSGVAAGAWRPLQPHSWRARQHQKLASELVWTVTGQWKLTPKIPEKRPVCDRVGVTGKTP